MHNAGIETYFMATRMVHSIVLDKTSYDETQIIHQKLLLKSFLVIIILFRSRSGNIWSHLTLPKLSVRGLF